VLAIVIVGATTATLVGAEAQENEARSAKIRPEAGRQPTGRSLFSQTSPHPAT